MLKRALSGFRLRVPNRPRLFRKRKIDASWSAAVITSEVAPKQTTTTARAPPPRREGVPAPLVKPKIVILGCGWGAYSFLSKIKRNYYDVIVISPRNHFLFTPLLTSTTVGTLEFRCVTEPIRSLYNIKYHQARCIGINEEDNELTVRDSFDKQNLYNIKYDALIYAVGAKANDFGVSGVQEHCLFLKQVKHAMAIREKIQELFERASKPTTTRLEREKMLSIVIVGGGPTSIEFAAELHDWLMEDGLKMFPQLLDQVSITLVEATNRILAGFSQELAEYTMKTFAKRKIHLLLNSQVTKVTAEHVELADGYKIHYGMAVWATGNAPVDLTDSLEWDKTRGGRIKVDENLSVISDKNKYHNIFAIGDCAEHLEKPLAPTAQCAKQQGFYLASMMNDLLTQDCRDWQKNMVEYANYRSFAYSHRGMMAYVGGWKGVVSVGDIDNPDIAKWRQELRHRLWQVQGIQAWLFWRSAYFTMIRSWPNQILVPMYWFKAWMFGRDFSRF